MDNAAFIQNKLPSKEICCGCSSCYATCKLASIEMKTDKEGFYYPIINNNCIKCENCVKACPILKSPKLDKHNIKVIHGRITNKGLLKGCASGGAATILSQCVLKSGGVVYGSAYSLDYKSAEYMRIDNTNNLHLLKSSKYFETKKKNIYSSVLNDLVLGEKVLFIGLPCDIAGLSTFLKKNLKYYNNLVTCELICHGITSSLIHKQYIEEKEKKYASSTTYFSCRENIDNKVPYVLMKFKNGCLYKRPLWDTEYGYAFAHFCRPSCYNCKFKENNRLGDISIGDSWQGDKDFGYNVGISIIYIHTRKGIELVRNVQESGEFEWKELDYEQIKYDNPAIYKSLEGISDRKKYSDVLVKRGVFAANWRTMSLKQKIMKIVKMSINRLRTN